MNELTELRSEIDEIDKKIIFLFARRMDIANQIGAIKFDQNLPTKNSQREREVLAQARANGGVYADYAEQIMKNIIDMSCQIQDFHSIVDKD